MKNQKISEQQYSNWENFKSFLISRIKEREVEQEKAEQKKLSEEVEEIVKGKEIILDNMCY